MLEDQMLSKANTTQGKTLEVLQKAVMDAYMGTLNFTGSVNTDFILL